MTFRPASVGRGDDLADVAVRIRDAVARRDALATQVNKLEARREAAKINLAEVEAECRAKGVNPDQIDDILSKLEARLQDAIDNLEVALQMAERTIEPFLKETA
jgi:hypothetical protein